MKIWVAKVAKVTRQRDRLPQGVMANMGSKGSEDNEGN